jgi:hypothetical protein
VGVVAQDGVNELLLGSDRGGVGLGVDVGGHVLDGSIKTRYALDSDRV